MKIVEKLTLGLLISLVFIAISPTHAEEIPQCNVNAMLQLLSSDLDKYESVQMKTLEQSSEGTAVAYYYAGSVLKAVKSIYYGETGKATIEYRFKSPRDYVVDFTKYFYTAPIYIEGSKIAAINENKFTVCGGKLVRGIGDDVVINNFKKASKALRKILRSDPKKTD